MFLKQINESIMWIQKQTESIVLSEDLNKKMKSVWLMSCAKVCCSFRQVKWCFLTINNTHIKNLGGECGCYYTIKNQHKFFQSVEYLLYYFVLCDVDMEGDNVNIKNVTNTI